MGTVYRKTFTKPLPPGVDIFTRKGERFARWKTGKGKTRTAPVTIGYDNADRLVVEAGTFTAKYRDGAGHVLEVATGCRDEMAARGVLADLERRAELVKAKVMTSNEDAIADHQTIPLTSHVADFLAHQTARDLCKTQLDDTRRRIKRVSDDCGFKNLADLTATAIEKWLTARQAEGMGARTRNCYRQAWVTFGNWCVRNRRILMNPFSDVFKADEQADPRRKRRALTEDELQRLLDVARRRPLIDAATVRRGERRGEAIADLRPETRRRLERLGMERALIYKTLVLTGLRKSELASLTVAQLDLDADPAFVLLDAADAKNRTAATIPLRSDLAAELRDWLTPKAAHQDAAGNAATVRFDAEAGKAGSRNASDSGRREGQACQQLTTLPPDSPVFTVPARLVMILDRDLKAAGIAKRDERGRTVDVHAMRHTFGTLLSKTGAAPRTAQAAMRHSDINMTMNVYTDPKLLDIVGAVEALPALSLTGPATNAAKATGTDGGISALAPTLAPTSDNPCKLWSTADKMEGLGGCSQTIAMVPTERQKTTKKGPLDAVSNEPVQCRGAEIRTRDLLLPKQAR